MDQYTAGLNNTICHGCTNCILDSVVKALVPAPQRTFVYVEQGFFQRWWRAQPPPVRAATRALIAKGQLQFANGGWCMHDEATAHYVDMVDQTTYGHRFLKEEFGVVPQVCPPPPF